MKHFSLSGTLLVSYAVYSAFVPVSTPHSIILFSLAAFAGLDSYIKSHHLPSTDKKIELLRLELLEQIQKQKEAHEAKLQEIEGTLTRQAIAKVNESLPSSKNKPTPVKF